MSKNCTYIFLVILFSTLIFAVLFEVALRGIFYKSMDFDIEMWKYAVQIKRKAENPRTGHEHTPNSSAHLMGSEVKINANKLRDREISFDKPDGVTRIMMLGDSLTFGWGVDIKDTTSKIIEKILAKKFPEQKIEVINAGVGNYNTGQQISYFLDEGFKFEPDIIVLNYFINDAETLPAAKGNFFFNWSYAYTFIKSRVDTLSRQYFGKDDWIDYYNNLYKGDLMGWTVVVDSFQKLAKYSRENAIEFVVANYPELHNVRKYPFKGINRKIRILSGKVGAKYINLLEEVKNEKEETLWVTPTDLHPNATANHLYGDRISRELDIILAGKLADRRNR